MCVHCERKLSWFENIPLFSFLFLKGKCRTCGKPIPKSYFLVELATGVIFTLVVGHSVDFNLSAIQSFRDLFFSALLIVVFVYDAKYQLILPSVILLGSTVGLFINIKYLVYDPYNLVFGALICGGFFLFQFLVSKGKWIGGGDIMLGAMMGFWLGWQAGLAALFISYIFGAVFSLALIALKKKEMSSAIPFGTFLSIGTFVVLLWGNEIISWYLRLVRY